MGISEKVSGYIGPAVSEKGRSCFDWLIQTRLRICKAKLGNHSILPVAQGLPKHEPIIVWTSLIGQAFLDAYQLLHEKISGYRYTDL